MRSLLPAGVLLLSLVCAPPAAADQAADQAAILTGAAVLVERHGVLWHTAADQPPRIGLITNASAVMPDGTPDVNALAKLSGLRIVEILSPEHGFKVDSQSLVSDSADRVTGLPIYSLYGKHLEPTPKMLAHVDALVFDIQDVGARFYTYISTMYLAMEAAAKAHKRFVVLDRPDPIGGTIVEGGVLDPRFRSFNGIFPIPVRHGMTVGELARLFNTRIGCNLIVVPMEGWQRDMWWDQTGLPWVDPSPAMVCLTAAELYPGMCFFEATNVDPRIGATPFEEFGAPWLDGDRLATQLTALHLPGVEFQGVAVSAGEPRSGEDWPVGSKAIASSRPPLHQAVRLIVTDRDAMRPVRVALCALSFIHRDYGSLLQVDTPGFDRLAGTDRVLKELVAGDDPLSIADRWDSSLPRFERERRAFLLYP